MLKQRPDIQSSKTIFKTCICGDMDMGVRVKVPRKTINEFCRRNQIRKLLFFGSVLRDDFTNKSDVDVLVEFDENAKIGLIGLDLQILLDRL